MHCLCECLPVDKPPALRWLLFLPLVVVEGAAALLAYYLMRGEPANNDHPQHPSLIRYGGLAAAGLYVLTLDYCFSFIAPFTESEHIALGHYALFGLLTILPPIYFFIEATYFYGKDFGDCHNLKHSQELASRVWAAMTLLLTFYWFHAKA